VVVEEPDLLDLQGICAVFDRSANGATVRQSRPSVGGKTVMLWPRWNYFNCEKHPIVYRDASQL
jgi:hypothetical protein